MHPRLYDRSYWEGETSNYSDGGYHDGPHLAQDADSLLHVSDGRVLEIGCAYGFVLRRLRDHGLPCVGVDLSRYALQRARDAGVDVVQSSGTDLPFRDQVFAVAYSRDTLEHIPNVLLADVFAELLRVARTGFHYVTVEGQRQSDRDITHVTMRPLEWWEQRMPPRQEVFQA